MNKLEISPIKMPPVTELVLSFSSHSLKIYEDSKVLPPKVSEWLNKEGRWGKFFYIVCTIYSVLHIASAFRLNYDDATAPLNWQIRAGDSLFHALIMIVGAIFVYADKLPAPLDARNLNIDSRQSREEIEKGLKRASEAIKRFLPYWRLVWLFWFFLYLSLAAFYFFSADNTVKPKLWFFNTIHNTFNNFTALFFYAMYHELSERTLDEEYKKGLWQILLMILVLIAAAELALSWHLHTEVKKLDNIHLIFSIISGVLTGFATALLTTRFASRIIDVPQGAIFILILYCLIQPLFPMVLALDSGNMVYAALGQVAVSIAIYGKATLLVLIHWMRFTHRLTYYMVRALELMKEEGPRRIAFVNELLPDSEKVVPITSVQGKDVTQKEKTTHHEGREHKAV